MFLILKINTNKQSYNNLESRNKFGLVTTKYFSYESQIETDLLLFKRGEKNIFVHYKIIPN